MIHGGVHVSRSWCCMPRGSYTPLPSMAEYRSFAPPCMVAEPNDLVLKILLNPIKFEICFKFELKIKKILGGSWLDQRVKGFPKYSISRLI